jgi:Zn-dependent protease
MNPRFEVLPPGPPAQPKSKGIFAMIGAGIIALLKFKYLLIGGLKTSLSMFIMIWFYSTMFGWPYATGVVLLIFVHEMGHVIAAKWLGMPVSAPIFIPFVGAYINLKEHPRDAWTEALMAYGGPLAGCIGGWACFFYALDSHIYWLIAVASTTFVINLFNMIPVPPLDGGRICAAVSAWFWFIGLILLGAAVFYFHAGISILIILAIVLVSAIPRLKQTLFQPPTDAMKLYYTVHPGKRLLMAAMYVALIAVLILGYWQTLQILNPSSD